MSTALLSDFAIKIPVYDRNVAYDDSLKGKEGYWYCAGCETSKAKNAFLAHATGCRLRTAMTVNEPEIIYVTGPNDQGTQSPFSKKDFKIVKMAADTAKCFKIVLDRLGNLQLVPKQPIPPSLKQALVSKL